MDKIKTDNNPEIWYPYEVFYIESMLTITRAAVVDRLLLRNIIDELTKGETKNRGLIIDLAQSIISHAATISRYFWPSNSDRIHKRRGQRLREAFSIYESNPIKNRDIRNFIEHFDEKLDLFIQENISGNIVPTFIGVRKDMPKDFTHFFRAYFIDEWRFQVLGMKYNLVPIINELIRIHRLLENFNEQGGRLPIRK